MDVSGNYEIFRRFVDRYLPSSFRDIATGGAFMKEMETLLRERRQFFCAGDLMEMRIDFVSQGVYDLFGLRPENMNGATISRLIHPADITRVKSFPSRVRRAGIDLFHEKEGQQFFSVTSRFLRHDRQVLDALFQNWAFYSKTPYESVFSIVIITDISHMSDMNNVQHHYVGRDPSFFRYPDQALLATGHRLSNRELEILRLVAQGMESHEIAKELSLSVHTINTHRRNILRKEGNANIHDLIYSLNEQGML